MASRILSGEMAQFAPFFVGFGYAVHPDQLHELDVRNVCLSNLVVPEGGGMHAMSGSDLLKVEAELLAVVVNPLFERCTVDIA